MSFYLKIHKIFLIISLLLFSAVSCGTGSSSDDDFEYIGTEKEKIIPSNLTLLVTIVGTNNENLNGDGTGVVQFIANANNAVKYIYKIDNGTEQETIDGTFEYTFKKEGTNNYTIEVFAYSSTGDYVTISKTIEVFVAEHEPQLVWFDEFDTNGKPDDSKWGYNIGRGTNGWGNGESQYYTDRSENVIVEDGYLKIIAKKEDYNGASYTSARLLTQDKFEFTYGRLDVRAKLPEGEGTWPAIWMLGANIDTVGWPACGEIDIMEHWGHNPTQVSSATHTPAHYGGSNGVHVGTTTLNDYATEFHVYSIEWTEDELRFLIDGEYKYKYKPLVKNSDNWPFTKDQFIILNVAMGGSWFSIDPEFTQSTMEIDYVRVYQ